jgi:DUF2075 family protein
VRLETGGRLGVIIYQSTTAGFLDHLEEGSIVERISAGFARHGMSTPAHEVDSWQNSLNFMHKVLAHRSVPEDCDVAIEFSIPQTQQSRIDFMIIGNDHRDRGAAVIVELKQWKKIAAIHEQNEVVRTWVGGAERVRPHPSYQAWSYSASIEDFNLDVRAKNVQLRPCAWLHNYARPAGPTGVFDEIYAKLLEKAPVFCEADARTLRDFICRNIKSGDGGKTLYDIENGKLRPSKQLQDAVASMLEGSQEFVLIDEQKVVFEEARALALRTRDDGVKRVLIVEGGPGTGKSVVAITLLVELLQEGLIPQYVSKNRAPRKVYAKLLRGRQRLVCIGSLFKGSGHFHTAKKNSIGAAIVDEAHRLTAKSDRYKTKGINQIKEIIAASEFSIFFIDESQRVHVDDIGRVDDIVQAALDGGAQVYRETLPSQFRCNGSDSYLDWLDEVLGLRPSSAAAAGLQYDFRVFDDPGEMAATIERLNRERNKCRMVAGYCWEWDTKQRDNPDHHDVVVEARGFSASWNLGSTETWAIDPHSVHQIGCIHTAQGLEFEYVGVLIGDDMRFEGDRVVTDYTRRARTDQSLKGIKTIAKKDPDRAQRLGDELIRNTYRVLMTRGLKGCFVFCTDPALAAHFREALPRVEYAEPAVALPIAAEGPPEE